MQKGKKYDWKDSNMALFGSDKNYEKKVKKESAESEPAWQGCGQEVGVKVWRIVKFKVEDWPAEQYGEFFNGDSYIVLNTYKEEEEIKYDVHFWIGKYSTQDEYSTAAYKTVELDTFLDDKPIQHREVQGHESSSFKSYFESMKLLKGGADTGFNRVLPEAYVPRLFHVGKKLGNDIVTCTEVSMKKGNLKSEDVFIIDIGSNIYQWNGSNCSHDEKFKAAAEISKMKSERQNKPKIITLEEDSCSPQHPVMTHFKDGESKAKSDAVGERKMFEISEEDGDDSMEEIAADGDISKELLKKGNVYIINTGNHVWCWIGSEASVDERKNGMPYACNYINGTKTPWLPVTVVKDGKESEEFKNAF